MAFHQIQTVSVTQGRANPLRPFRKMVGRRGTFIAISASLLASCIYGQSQPIQNPVAIRNLPVTQGHNAAQRRPPLSHLYMHFLLLQNHLEKVAAEREAQGKNAAWMHNYFQKGLRFTDSEFSTLRSTGLRLESELKQIDTRAKEVIQAYRAANPPKPGVLPPRPPSVLADLTKEREDTIESEVEKLNRDLGPVTSAKLQDYIQKAYAQTPGLIHHHPRPSKTAQPLSRLPYEVQHP
jgi:hypothetical protein